MKNISLFLFLTLVSSWLFASDTNLQANYPVDRILRLEINSSINPATLNYLQAGFKHAASEDYQALLVIMNTPGGLVSTTKEILTLFGASDIPVIIWIRPEGASATSAGAIIAAGAHILFMSDGTNIGAATPIEISGDIKQEDARSKAVNDLVALVQSLAETRGRNAKLFGEMIEKASSFKSQEAAENKLTDGTINTVAELKKSLHNRVIKIKGKKFKIQSNEPLIESFDMDLGQKLLDILANPSTAYILFILGAGLIYLELQTAGGFIAGGIGAVCLLLAGIGFQILPLNFGALGLIVLAFALLVMEIYVTSYGILTLAGVASLVTGSLFLFRTDDAYLHLSTTVIFSTVGAILTFVGLIVWVIIRDRSSKHEVAFNNSVGHKATILAMLEPGIYQVKVNGEVWRAKGATTYQIGDHVMIETQDDSKMELTIQSKL